jgi:hypothetical protein
MAERVRLFHAAFVKSMVGGDNRTLTRGDSFRVFGLDRNAVLDEDLPIEIPITDVFDLHSVPARDAKGIVEAYLEEAQERGFRYVRIIHGRGIGAQREMVRTVLARTPFVEAFGDAPMEAGGWGATVVTLRQRASAPR